jgi:hypothetical protein
MQFSNLSPEQQDTSEQRNSMDSLSNLLQCWDVTTLRGGGCKGTLHFRPISRYDTTRSDRDPRSCLCPTTPTPSNASRTSFGRPDHVRALSCRSDCIRTLFCLSDRIRHPLRDLYIFPFHFLLFISAYSFPIWLPDDSSQLTHYY